MSGAYKNKLLSQRHSHFICREKKKERKIILVIALQRQIPPTKEDSTSGSSLSRWRNQVAVDLIAVDGRSEKEGCDYGIIFLISEDQVDRYDRGGGGGGGQKLELRQAEGNGEGGDGGGGRN